MPLIPVLERGRKKALCSRSPYLNNTKGVTVCENIADKGKRKNENKPEVIFNKSSFFRKELFGWCSQALCVGRRGGRSGVHRQCGVGVRCS